MISTTTLITKSVTSAVLALLLVFVPFRPHQHGPTTATMMAYASPMGASDCPPNQAAVGDPHKMTGLTITTGSLSDGAIQFTVDGATLLAGAVADIADDGTTTHSLDVTTAADGGFFRGFLIRAQSLTGEELDLLAGTDSILSILCDSPAVGVTHTSNNDKTQAGGTLSPLSGTVVFDVTVVVTFRDGVSEYYYDQYTVNFAPSQAAPPSLSPVAASPAAPASPAADSPGDSPIAPVTGSSLLPSMTPEMSSVPSGGPAMVGAVPTDAPVSLQPPANNGPPTSSSAPTVVPPTGMTPSAAVATVVGGAIGVVVVATGTMFMLL